MCNASPTQRPGEAGRGWCRLLALELIIAALSLSVRAQISVTLAWDPPGSGPPITGYRLYQGTASRQYDKVIPVGAATTNTVTGLVRGATYFFAVTACDTSGLESDFSSEISYRVPAPADVIVTNDAGLTFAADSGAISPPFVVGNNGTIVQPSETSLENSGRAVYRFNLPSAGSYIVSALATAPNEGQNSFYVNIDAEPTNPLMIWDIPVCTTLTRHFVSWRGNGNASPIASQYRPKVFTLGAGWHEIVIRGREANTTLGAISLVAAPPALQMQPAYGGWMILSGTGQPGQTYRIQRSHDLRTWSPIGAVTLDSSGAFEFWDFAAVLPPVSLYRLARTTVTPPTLQLRTKVGGSAVLEAVGENSQMYEVLCSSDLKDWRVIGTLMLDAGGWGQFTDSTARNWTSRTYRLRGQ